jgi:hypothetical protein
MIFTFYPDIIPGVGVAEIISGETPFHFSNTEYLVVQNGEERRAFQINYEYHLGPFKQAAIQENLLLVGYQQHFYLYDLAAKCSLLILKLESYFSNFYLDEDFYFVADAGGLYKITAQGVVLWHNANLGIDGVIVEQFTQSQVMGSGEWDPPGGWRSFVLDKITGKIQ